MKSETINTVKFCFDVLAAGVVFMPFDDIINPIRTFCWLQGMIIPVIQAKVVDNNQNDHYNDPKWSLKVFANSLIFRNNSPFSLSIMSV